MSRMLRHSRLLVFPIVLAALLPLAGCSPTVPSCVYSLSPSAVTLPAAGGAVTVTVATASGCSWTATPGASWLTVAQGGSGSGAGTVSLSAGPNGPTPRSTTLAIGSQSIAVTQEGAAVARYTISGRVTDVFLGPGPGLGLSGVTVSVSGGAGSGSATTEYDGNFSIAGLPNGVYTVTFDKTFFRRLVGTHTVSGPLHLLVALSLDTPATPSVSNLTGYWTGVGTYPNNPFKLALIHTGNQLRGTYVDSKDWSPSVAEWRMAMPEFTLLVNFGDAGLLLECVIEDARRVRGVQRTPSLGNRPYPFEMTR